MSSSEPPVEWSLSSPDETVSLGRALGASLVGGLVIGLVGQLGAGKTHLVKGMAAGNADNDDYANVTSPTFTLVHEYDGRLALIHIDAYRLNSVKELLSLGFDEMCGLHSVVVVEWADRVADALPDDRLTLTFAMTGTTCRSIVATAGGPLARECLSALRTEMDRGVSDR